MLAGFQRIDQILRTFVLEAVQGLKLIRCQMV